MLSEVQVTSSMTLPSVCSLRSCVKHLLLFLQCGVADGEGFLSIWQVNQTASNPKPYMVSTSAFPEHV